MLKQLTVCIALCLGSVLGAGAQSHVLIRFDERNQTLDTLRYDGGVQTLRYPFTNVSDIPVTVMEVRASCGCFTGEVAQTRIKPGGRGVLLAKLDPAELYGPQNRFLNVLVQGREGEVFNYNVSVKTYVKAQLTEGQIRYYTNLGDSLRTDAPRVLVNRRRDGQYVFSFPLYNDTDFPKRLEYEPSARLKLIQAPEFVPPRSRVDVKGTYNPLWRRWGSEQTEPLRIKADGKELPAMEMVIHL